MISLDCETTGLDLHHGAKPFLVTTCDEEGNNTWWEWVVQPNNREPIIVYEDLTEIQDITNEADCIVLQNAKFDYVALQTVFLGRLQWDWGKVHDTLLAGHLLASNHPHDLAAMVMEYLSVDILPYEQRAEKAVKECRRMCQGKHAKFSSHDWRIAGKDLPEMPSAKGSKLWKIDLWLPRAIADKGYYDKSYHYWTVTSEYANVDSASTLSLFKRQRELLKQRGLWRIYLERLKLLPIICTMEKQGVTISRTRLEELQEEYTAETEKAGRVCVNIAASYSYDLTLPKSGNNKSLKEFMLGPLGLEPIARSKKTGEPSLDKATLEHWEATLPERSKQLSFVKSLRAKRKRDTALQYMEGYKRFWLPMNKVHQDLAVEKLHRGDVEKGGCAWQEPVWYRLHPSLNPTGTDTLRFSSSNPNSQNVSKQEGFSLRYCFGPAPGREWWCLDAENIELRIPAYESGEKEMVELFENKDKPPYYGSYHLFVFDILHPEKFAKHGVGCKKIYESTWYAWTKNGNFASQYGAVEASGTADRAYHVPGAQHKVQRRFSKMAALNRLMIELAEEHGYVETMPNKTVDPKRGYPLLCSRSRWGGIQPTVPLNYHVSGTAMWWMQSAMIRCQEYIDELNARPGVENRPELQAHMILQVHDELVFDFPKAVEKKGKAWYPVNLQLIHHIQGLMEKGGEDIGVPTPVSIDYHAETWSEGVGV